MKNGKTKVEFETYPGGQEKEMMDMIEQLWLVCKVLALANIDLALAWLLLSQLIGLVVSVIGGGKDE